MSGALKSDHVFVNCPFDKKYLPLRHAIVFALHDCGFVARSALEADDSGTLRMDKLYEIIGECRLGVHDISCTELDPVNNLPRFNMPLELGIFLGAARYGGKIQNEKQCLILDRASYRYQMFCSDLSGMDIGEHGDDPLRAIAAISQWASILRTKDGVSIPGGQTLQDRYEEFANELPDMCDQAKIKLEELTFPGHVTFVVAWLKKNPW